MVECISYSVEVLWYNIFPLEERITYLNLPTYEIQHLQWTLALLCENCAIDINIPNNMLRIV